MKRRLLLAIARRLSALAALVLPGGLYEKIRREVRVQLGLQKPKPHRHRPAQAPVATPTGERSEASAAPVQNAADSPDGNVLDALVKKIVEVRVEKDDLALPTSPCVSPGGKLFEAPPRLPCALARAADLVLCCAFTGRHRILHRAIEESLQVDGVFWMIVGSTEEDWLFIRSVATTTGRVAGFVCDNRPLGRKWQTCLHAAGAFYNAPLYGITGSDDLLSPTLLQHIIAKAQHAQSAVDPEFRPSVYATLEWLVVVTDPKSRWLSSVFRCNYAGDSAFQTLGAGRFYSRAFLEGENFMIFESDKERLLDDRGHFAVKAREGLIEYYGIEDGPVISVKGDWSQLNAIDAFMTAKQLDVREFSFEGRALLSRMISGAAFRHLFRPSRFGLQSTFGGQSGATD